MGCMGKGTIVSAIPLPIWLIVVTIGGLSLSGPTMDTDLSSSSASFVGEDINDWSGYSVSTAGDVNGDGYDDLIFGAPLNDDGGVDAGKTYLVLGKNAGWKMRVDLSKADASFVGEDAGDQSGISVACAGDVNKDGYDDILIGAYRDDDGGTDAGQTYLILGRETGWARNTDLSKSNASFWGERQDDNSGFSVSGAGDVNGDGYDDFLIGAHLNDCGRNPGYDNGQTYLILGRPSGWTMDMDLSSVNASFCGETSSDLSGYSVAGAGDVNKDGFDDIIIGAYGDLGSGSWSGRSYLVMGRRSGWAMDMNLSDANASFYAEASGDYSGFSVAGANDVNGDGYDDLLIGAPRNDEGGSNAGQAYLFFGKNNGWSMDTNLSKANASFLGENANDQAGFSVAAAEDVNGDGFDDIRAVHPSTG